MWFIWVRIYFPLFCLGFTGLPESEEWCLLPILGNFESISWIKSLNKFILKFLFLFFYEYLFLSLRSLYAFILTSYFRAFSRVFCYLMFPGFWSS